MIPNYIRVAAIDNDLDHLNKIYSGLVRAGFWVMPFHYDLGRISPMPPAPFNGVRLVFTDIHLSEGQMSNMPIHAMAIIESLKRIVCDGPYAIMFWTQYPEDADNVMQEIRIRAKEADFLLPVAYGCINKSLVIGSGEEPENLEEFKRQLDSEIHKCGALLLSISWEERVSQAAIKSTHRLFELSQKDSTGEESIVVWQKLLSSLSTSAVGTERANLAPSAAMDAALLPILEDRLQGTSSSVHSSLEQMLIDQFGNWPENVSKSSLNSHYLIEAISQPNTVLPSGRGVVSRISRTAWDENHPDKFGLSCSALVGKEFFLIPPAEGSAILDSVIPCVVTLTPECDDVQGKVGAFRYLLAILVPCTDANRRLFYSRTKASYANLSIFSAGTLDLDIDDVREDYILLISCNRFFAKPDANLLHATPLLRLRRGVLEELSHHYATHARRPGVMRFS